jgi:hypothetical protein
METSVHSLCAAILLAEFGMGRTRHGSLIGFAIFILLGIFGLAISLWPKLTGRKK